MPDTNDKSNSPLCLDNAKLKSVETSPTKSNQVTQEPKKTLYNSSESNGSYDKGKNSHIKIKEHDKRIQLR